jgi:hypothetical protein
VLTAERWADLAFVVKVTRERTVLSTNKSSTETAYYPRDAQRDVIPRGSGIPISDGNS